jgi:hypothetical protein
MKKKMQKQLFIEFTNRQLDVIESKQNDYTDPEECVLGNFKTAGANAGIKTEQQILSLMATKVARLGNLFKGKTPNNESIDDSIIDLANYTFLLYCYFREEYQTDINVLMESEPITEFKFHPNTEEFLSQIKRSNKFRDNCY